MLDESEDIAKVGSLGAHLTMLSKAGLRVVSGFIIPSGFALIDGMSNEILRSFDRLESRSVVLRASLSSHDLDGEVIRDVTRDVLLDTVTYVQKNAARHGRNAAIIIQKNLAAETAGTIHSINPVTKDAKEVLILPFERRNVSKTDTAARSSSERSVWVLICLSIFAFV